MATTNSALKAVEKQIAEAYVYGGNTPAGSDVIPQILGGKQVSEIREIADVQKIISPAVAEMKKALRDFDLEAFARNLGTVIGVSLVGSRLDAFETAQILATSADFSELGSPPDAVWHADILTRNVGGGISGALNTGNPDRACDRIIDTVAVATALVTENSQEVVNSLTQGTEVEGLDWSSLPRVVMMLPKHAENILKTMRAGDFKGFEKEFKITLGIAIAGEYFAPAREVEKP